jgi:hypothetical protein
MVQVEVHIKTEPINRRAAIRVVLDQRRKRKRVIYKALKMKKMKRTVMNTEKRMMKKRMERRMKVGMMMRRVTMKKLRKMRNRKPHSIFYNDLYTRLL